MNFIAEAIQNISGEMHIDMEYDRNRNCDESCNPYCRCSTLSNFRISDPDSLLSSICYHVRKGIPNRGKNKIKLTTFQKYFIDKSIELLIKEDPESAVDLYGVRGYYGEEPSSKLSNSFQCEAVKYFDSVDPNKEIECIKKLLELEYGYLLPELESKKSASVKSLETIAEMLEAVVSAGLDEDVMGWDCRARNVDLNTLDCCVENDEAFNELIKAIKPTLRKCLKDCLEDRLKD